MIWVRWFLQPAFSAKTGVLFALRVQRLTHSPEWTVAGGVRLRIPVRRHFDRKLHMDGRWQSETNTGSNLDPRKVQDDYAVFGAKLGFYSEDEMVRAWSSLPATCSTSTTSTRRSTRRCRAAPRARRACPRRLARCRPEPARSTRSWASRACSVPRCGSGTNSLTATEISRAPAAMQAPFFAHLPRHRHVGDLAQHLPAAHDAHGAVLHRDRGALIADALRRQNLRHHAGRRRRGEDQLLHRRGAAVRMPAVSVTV